MDTWPFLTSFLLKAIVGMELQFGLAVLSSVSIKQPFLLNRELFALKEASATAILHSNHFLSLSTSLKECYHLLQGREAAKSSQHFANRRS
jgi:hypothetical protein